MSAQVTFDRSGDRLRCEIPGIPDWDGFDKLIRFLEQSYDAVVSDKVDGPDARRWVLEARGVELEVLHESDWGNTLVSTSAASDAVLETIGKDLAARLEGMPAPTTASAELDASARGVMKHAAETLNDPTADARIEARRDARERRQELIIVGQRAARDPASAAVVSLADRGELLAYLTLRKACDDDGAIAFADGDRKLTARWDEGASDVIITDGSTEHRAPLGDGGELSSRAVEQAIAAFK